MATDSGIPALNASVSVRVVVTDLNDNPPKFDQPSYDTTITDLATRGQFVTIVTCFLLELSASPSPQKIVYTNMQFCVVEYNFVTLRYTIINPLITYFWLFLIIFNSQILISVFVITVSVFDVYFKKFFFTTNNISIS